MRLTILAGILAALFHFACGDFIRLAAAQEEERQAWELYRELQTKLPITRRDIIGIRLQPKDT